MDRLFLGATALIVFAFAALSLVLWMSTPFLKVGSFDFRFLMFIGVALLGKIVHDRVKVVLKQET